MTSCLMRLFSVDARQRLKLVNLRNSTRELALRVGSFDPFGLINIDDDSGFFKTAEGNDLFDAEADDFGTGLFGTIDPAPKGPSFMSRGTRIRSRLLPPHRHPPARPGQRTVFRRVHPRRPRGRCVRWWRAPAHFRHRLQPLLELLVQIPEVAKAAAEDKIPRI